MTIWIVTEGEYSDYHIVAVMSNKHEAERLAKEASGTVEEWPVDELLGYVLRATYRVTVWFKSGEINRHERSVPKYASPDARALVDSPRLHDPYFSFRLPLVVEVDSFISYEHAETLAAELRQAWLRCRNVSAFASMWDEIIKNDLPI